MGTYFAKDLIPHPGPREKEKSPGDIAEQILKNITDTAFMMDKIKVAKVKRSGLLTNKKYFLTDKKGNSIPIFKERPVSSSGDTIAHNIYDFGKDAYTKPAFSEVQISQEAIDELGAQGIGDMLIEDGFKPKDISHILGEENIDKWAYRPSPETLDRLAIKEELVSQDEVLGSLEILDNDIQNSLTEAITTPGGTPLDVASQTMDRATYLGHTEEVKEALELLEGPGHQYGAGMGPVEYYRTPTETLTAGVGDVSTTTEAVGTTAEAAGTTVEAVGTTSEAVAAGAEAVEAGGEIIEAGTEVTNGAGFLGKAGQAAGVIGQVMGGVKAVGGIEKIIEGKDVGQGVEDTIQGTISIATPWLLTTGPVGWAVVGANILEDLFFD